MTIYIVKTDRTYEGDSFYGAYSTLDKANERLAEVKSIDAAVYEVTLDEPIDP